MAVILGFLIAVAIGLTGVGGGVITAPVLILYMGLPAPVAVGTALAFVVLVKCVAVPVYIARGQVNWRILGAMAAGGAPGALAGSLLLQNAAAKDLGNAVLAAVGFIVMVSASLNLLRILRRTQPAPAGERRGVLAALCAIIGLEVGFSSAGAGALGTVTLFRFSRLTPSEVVGTDLMFGFVVSMVAGAAHAAGGTMDRVMLANLAAGGVFGAFAGARLATLLPGRVLKTAICLVLAVLGCQLWIKGVAAMLW
ncbi:MAG: sulfite exporter TauE/SafE family protein [Bryobacteraceae bacterium]